MEVEALERVRSCEWADVFKAGRLAAALHREAGGVVFSYRPGYAEEGGVPVATSLPLEMEARLTPAGAVPPFFAGLLPEGRRLTSLRRAVKTSADDELSLLLAVGNDLVGDVVVVPRGTRPARPRPLVRGGAWGEMRFSDVLASAGVVDPVSLAGVQDKASAAMISVPVRSEQAAYLLKLDPPEFPHLVANEHYFLARARAAGMRAAAAELVHDVEGRSGLLVRRFDRPSTELGEVGALACEDACQVMDRWPADKYNVSAEEVVRALADVCAARPVALRAFYQQLAFAWLTGNGDMHAKNLSVLATREGEWRAAPAYDLSSSGVYGDTTMALSMGGRREGLSRRHWRAFADSIGLPIRAADRVVEELLDALKDLVEELRARALPFGQRRTADLVALLRDRRRLMEAGR